MAIFKFFLKRNWFAILHFNFRVLPLKQAIKLPFDFKGAVEFVNLDGKVRIESKSIYRGMVKIGFQGSDMFCNLTTVIDLRGELRISGKVSVGAGSLLRVEKNGLMSIGRNVVIGARNIIFCEESISLNLGTITSWDCQIMDTDTHSLQDTVTGEIGKRSGLISIGSNCWIGNNVLINKCVSIPDNVIVASYSLCNKDYTSLVEPYTILAGIPVRKIASNKRMSGDKL